MRLSSRTESAICRLALFAVGLIGTGISFVEYAQAQQAVTDWTPFADYIPELRPNVLPPNLPPRNPNDRPWLIAPSMEIDETYTDNALGTATGRQSDLYTTVSPDLFISGQSPRLQGVLNLNPQGIFYLKDTSQNQVFLNLLSNGSAVLVPERLFFDEQASIGEENRTGLQGFGSQVPIPADQRTQQFTYSLSPHAYIPFNSETDAELRYRLSQVLYNGNIGAVINPLTGIPLAPLTNSTEQEGFAKLKTTALWDRVLVSVTGDYLDYITPGQPYSSQNLTAAVGASYLVERGLYATASAGYENLAFPELSQLNYSGPTWEVGGRFAPREDRLIALSYGSYEGRLGFKGIMRYAITPRISTFAQFSQQIVTPQQQTLQDLPLVTQTTPGTTLDETTGLPLYLTNPNFALQNGIFYAKSFQAGATATLDRNSFGLTFDYEDDKELAEQLAEVSPSQTSVGGYVTYSRDLSPDTVLTALAGYSFVSSAALGSTPNVNGRTATFGLNISYNISQTLQAHAGYTFQFSSGGLESTVLIDLVTVGVRKSF